MTDLFTFAAYQTPLTGEQLKEQGMRTAAENRSTALLNARLIAVELATRYGTVTADDVQAVLGERGITRDMIGNAAGSIFKGGAFEFTGNRIKSKVPKGHANELKVWRLK
jgi:hypothetical protein